MPNINFSERAWERVTPDTQVWWAGELDRPLVYLSVTGPLPPEQPRQRLPSYWSNFPLEMPTDGILDRFEPFLAATHFYGDAFP